MFEIKFFGSSIDLSLIGLSGADREIVNQISAKDRGTYRKVGFCNLIISLAFTYACFVLIRIFFDFRMLGLLAFSAATFAISLYGLRWLTKRLINKGSSESRFYFFTTGFFISLVIGAALLLSKVNNKRLDVSKEVSGVYTDLSANMGAISSGAGALQRFEDSLTRKYLKDSADASVKRKGKNVLSDSLYDWSFSDSAYFKFQIDSGIIRPFTQPYREFAKTAGAHLRIAILKDTSEIAGKINELKSKTNSYYLNYKFLYYHEVKRLINDLRSIPDSDFRSILAFYDPNQFRDQTFSRKLNLLLKYSDAIVVIVFVFTLILLLIIFGALFTIIDSHNQSYKFLLYEKSKLNLLKLEEERKKIAEEYKTRTELQNIKKGLELRLSTVNEEDKAEVIQHIQKLDRADSLESLMTAATISLNREDFDSALRYINLAIDKDSEMAALEKSHAGHPELYEMKADILRRKNLFIDAEEVEKIAVRIKSENSFNNNKGKKILLESLALQKVSIFDDFIWNFQPGVNILLGRNGYGKSHLFGLIVALLYDDKKKIRDWVGTSGKDVVATLSLWGETPAKEIEKQLEAKINVIETKQKELNTRANMFTREGHQPDEDMSQKFQPEIEEIKSINAEVIELHQRIRKINEIVGDCNTIQNNIGKIPVLAIPDSRFIDKSRETIKGSADGTDLGKNGAHEFLYGEPYANVIENVLFKACISYLEKGKKFTEEPFDLIRKVIRDLSSDKLITRDGKLVYQDESRFEFVTIGSDEKNGSFTIIVQPEDSPINLPIQKVSQGTFSIVAICCLVYNFLKSVYDKEVNLLEQFGVVIIDELDAHIHPTWQRKLVHILRKNFPNIQFIISAHSPLMVSVCKANEVSVLRRTREGKFKVETLDQSLVGCSIEDIYSTIFEVENRDYTMLRYKELAPYINNFKNELEELKTKAMLASLSADETNRAAELQDIIEHIDHLAPGFKKIDKEQEEKNQNISDFLQEVSEFKL